MMIDLIASIGAAAVDVLVFVAIGSSIVKFLPFQNKKIPYIVVTVIATILSIIMSVLMTKENIEDKIFLKILIGVGALIFFLVRKKK